MFVATSESSKQLLNYVGQRGRASIFVLLLLDLTGKLFLIKLPFFPIESQFSADRCFPFNTRLWVIKNRVMT